MDVLMVEDPLRPRKDLTGGDAVLDALGRDIGARLRETEQRAAAVFEEDRAYWEDLVRRLTSRHSQLAAMLHEAGQDLPPQVWMLVREYYTSSFRSLWPLSLSALDRFGKEPPAGRVWTDAVEALEAFSESLPTRVEASLDPDVYASGVDDNVYVSIRKMGTRMRLWLRTSSTLARNQVRSATGSPELPLPGSTRPVPVRDIIGYHASARVAGEVEQRVVQSERGRRERANRLVAALARWNRSILEAEHRLDMPTAQRDVGEKQVTAWNDIQRAATRLQSDLEALREMEWGDIAEKRTVARLDEALEDDLMEGGTYLLGDRRVFKRNRRSAILADAARETEMRVERLAKRLELERSEYEVREAVLAHRKRLLERMEQLSMHHVRKTFRAMRRQIDDARDELAPVEDQEALTSTLTRLNDHLSRRLEMSLSNLPGIATAGIGAALPEGIDERATQSEKLPEQLLVAGDPDSGDPGTGRARIVELRRHADSAFNATINDRLRRPAESFRSVLLSLWNEADQAGQIIAFNIAAAREEVARYGTDAEVRKSMKALAAQGLERAVETLEQLEGRFDPAWEGYETAVFAASQADWLLFFRSANADVSPRQKVVGLRSRLGRSADEVLRKAQFVGDRGRVRLSTYSRLGRARTGAIVRRGRSAVGALPAAEQETLSALDAVTSADELLQDLPFVYRRLFAFEPVADSVFIEARDADLRRVEQHLERWRSGTTSSPIMLLHSAGTGRSSLLNIVEKRLVERGLRTFRIASERRYKDEADLAAELAGAFGLPEGPATLEDLAVSIRPLTAPKTAAIIFDHIESLMLQTPSGYTLLEKFLHFVARSDSSIFFLMAINPTARRLVAKAVPSASGLTQTHEPAELDAAAIQRVILNRHRRSGLRLNFEAPAHPSPILRQRLRRARSDEERQQRLQDDYFEKLYRSSMGGIRLALLQWLRSLRFEDDGTVVVSPVPPLNFGFLNDLDLSQAFSLRAILMHRTLNVEEHAHIFRTSPHEASTQMESLLDRRLIEPLNADGKTARAHVVSDVDYRVMPLLQKPISDALKNRNLI